MNTNSNTNANSGTSAVQNQSTPASHQHPSHHHSSHATHQSHQSHSSPNSQTTDFPPPPPRALQNPSIHPDFPHFPLNFLKKSGRSDDRLANLPPEDQAQIVHWFALGLTFTKIIELAAQPRPEGLNLRLSLGVVHRFYHKHDLAEKIAAAAELIAELCPENAADPDAAFQVLAQTHTLHAMAAPTLDQPAFRHLARYLQRQQEYKLRQHSLDLREKRLAFEMQHKHYDIFKRTVEKLPEINEIVRNESLSPGEKFREHCARIFGRDTVEMIERANRKWAEKHTEYAAQT